MVGHSVHISLLSLWQEERRVKVDHDDPVVLALAASDSVQDFVGDISGDVVKVASVRVGEDYRASR
jgi:hypothetical protein